MAWFGGSVSFSGSVPSASYLPSFNAPTYSYPSGATNITTSSSGHTGTATCETTVSRTYTTTYYWPAIGEYVTDSTTISGTAPACPYVPPPDTGGKMGVWNGSSWVKGITYVFNGTSWVQGTVYVYNGSAWVKSV